MAITLTIATLATADIVARRSLLPRSTSAIGVSSAAFSFVHGVLRISPPGTLLSPSTIWTTIWRRSTRRVADAL
ncbi:MAG: hypothetical protein OEV60_12350, partial [Actinomycetota bacterium]|nr:hypothetical protein [Actinomycetota bacterium]